MQQVALFAKNLSSAREKPCGDRAKSFGQILEELISIGFQDQSHKPLDHLSRGTNLSICSLIITACGPHSNQVAAVGFSSYPGLVRLPFWGRCRT